MSETKTVTVSPGTYQQMQMLRSRLAAADPRKLTPVFASFLERGASFSSIVSVGVALLERELDSVQGMGPATAELSTTPSKGERVSDTPCGIYPDEDQVVKHTAKPSIKKPKNPPDLSHLLPGEIVEFPKQKKKR